MTAKKYLNAHHSEFKNYYPDSYRLSSKNAEAKMQLDFYGDKLGQMLFLEDLNGMAWSIESRNPFADDRKLAQSIFKSLDFGQTLYKGYTKSTLREIGDTLLPKEINYRTDKKGFSVPDTTLTLQYVEGLKPYFFSDLLDSISSQEQRQQLFLKLNTGNEKEVQLFFRLSCLAMYYEITQA